MKFPQKRKVNVAAANNRKHDLSHVHATTMSFGRFKPIECRYMVPGDEFNYNVDAQIRALSSMPSPTFGEFKMRYRAFFVPIRSFWEHFYDFLANQQGEINGEYVDLACPYTTYGTFFQLFSSGSMSEVVSNPQTESEYDFRIDVGGGSYQYYRFKKLGCRCYDFLTSLGMNFPKSYNPDSSFNGTKVNVFPLIAFWKAYFDWIVPSRFQQEHVDNIELFITKMNSSGNYFVNLSDLEIYLVREPLSYFDDDLFTSSTYFPFQEAENTQDEISISNPASVSFVTAPNHETSGDDFSGASLFQPDSTFNVFSLETLGKLQDYLNRMLIAGRKVQDWLMTEFGLRPSDDALHLSTYLGKKEMTLQVESVLSSADTLSENGDTGVSLGSYGGYINNKTNFDFSYKSKEHGYFFITFELIPRTSYYQGINPEFNMIDRFDFFQPEFDNQQGAPISKNLLKVGAGDDVFGFTLQYAPLKFANDVLSGDFRNRFGQELKSWFLTRNIDRGLGFRIAEQWCQVNGQDNWNYIFSDTTDDVDHWLTMFFIHCAANRPMKSITEGFEPTYKQSDKDVTLSFSGAAN